MSKLIELDMLSIAALSVSPGDLVVVTLKDGAVDGDGQVQSIANSVADIFPENKVVVVYEGLVEFEIKKIM